MYPEQILIYQQQLRQHIQLAASNFLQLYIHPTLWSHAPQYKEYLVSSYFVFFTYRVDNFPYYMQVNVYMLLSNTRLIFFFTFTQIILPSINFLYNNNNWFFIQTLQSCYSIKNKYINTQKTNYAEVIKKNVYTSIVILRLNAYW